MRVSQASSLAFLPFSLHPGANEGGGRGHRSSRGSLQEDSGPGEGLAITGAQTGDKDCITERLFPSVYVPVSCLPRKSWGCGQRRGEGRMSVYFLYHSEGAVPLLLLELGWAGRGSDRDYTGRRALVSTQLSRTLS